VLTALPQAPWLNLRGLLLREREERGGEGKWGKEGRGGERKKKGRERKGRGRGGSLTPLVLLC